MRFLFFFFKPMTAYEMRISDWSSDVCSSDLLILVGIDAEEDRAGRHALVGLDTDFDHPATDLGRDLDQIGLRQPLRRIGRVAVGGDAVEKEHDADGNHDPRHAAYGAPGRRRLFRCWPRR